MIRVLRILNRFNLGGPTYNAAFLTKYLSSDYKTLLVGGAIDKSENSSLHILDELNVKPIIIPEMQRSINYNNDLVAYYKLKEIITRFKPDIIHTHASKAGSLGRWAAYRCNVPVIVHTFHGHVFHSYFGAAKTSIVKSVERSLAKISSSIVAISDKQKHELCNEHHIAHPDKVSVIPLGFDLGKFKEDKDLKRARFRKEYALEANEIAIGIIGRLVPIKNHTFFIDAVEELLKRTDLPLRFFIVGDGELRNEIEQYALSKQITCTSKKGERATLTFTSWIKEIDEVNAGLDMVTLCSLNEGTPVSLIEAQASGTPIVATNVGGIEDVVLQGKTAFLTNSNPADFAEKICMLAQDAHTRERMASFGWNHVENKFHYTRLVKDMEELYWNQLNAVKAKKGSFATA
jgi:glycosyltransferase involved in cell wall biosynthesis